MSLIVFLLVLAASVLHALWNYVARRVSGDLTVLWMGWCFGCLVLMPAVVAVCVFHDGPLIISREAWGYVIATGILHAIYFYALSAAYRYGELSLVYPISRGSGVGLTAVFALILLKETISPLGATGVALVITGIMVISTPAMARLRHSKSVVLALSVGCVIASYSLVDKVGVGQVQPVLYIWLMSALSILLMWPVVLRKNRFSFARVFQLHRKEIIAVGMGASVAYLLILYAFRQGMVSYVVATRELSIVFGTALGVTLLRERLTLPKVVATLMIVGGAILLKIG